MGERSIAPMVSLCSLLFDATLEALRYALDYHEILAALAPRARVGLHVGPVTLRDNSVQDTPAAPSLWRSKA